MSVKITFDLNAAAAKIRTASGKAMKEIKEQVLEDCNRYCPKDQGTLRDSARSHSHVMEYFGEAELRLIWATPYANFLYYGLVEVDRKTKSPYANFGELKLPTEKPLHYTTPGTGKLWCEKARAECGEDWRLSYQNALKKHLK